MHEVVLIYSRRFSLKLMTYILILFTTLFQLEVNKDLENRLLSALEKGNSKELSKHFTSSVRMSVNQDSRLTTKFQAELILEDYFNNNKLVNIKKSDVSEELSKQFIVFEAVSNRRKVRIFIKFVQLKGTDYISEFRID